MSALTAKFNTLQTSINGLASATYTKSYIDNQNRWTIAGYVTSPQQYYKLCTLTLPQGGNQARITCLLCNYFALNTTGTINQAAIAPQNYVLDINIYSSNGYTNAGVLSGASTIVTSNTSGQTSYGCFYGGHVVCNTPSAAPLGAYLVPNNSSPLTMVDVYILSYQSHGVPLVSISMSAGSYSGLNTAPVAILPTTGYVKLNQYKVTMTDA